MYEMWGATGVTPWAFTWSEYKRVFTGWRRHRWEHTGQICITVANGLLPRRDRRSWHLTDFCSLFKPPQRWKAVGAALADTLKGLFCRKPDLAMENPTEEASSEPSPDVPRDG